MGNKVSITGPNTKKNNFDFLAARGRTSFLQPVIMLPLLPNEIVLDILKLTVKSTTSAALNICLLSSDIGRLIRPILYRKVVIMNGRQDMAIRL